MMTELPSSCGSSDDRMAMCMMEPASFQSAAGPMNTATCNFPSSSGASSVFSSSFCGSPSELRKRAAGMGGGTYGHTHGLPNSGSIPIGSAHGDLGASPINTNLFSGFTPVFSHGASKPAGGILPPAHRGVPHSQMPPSDDPRGLLSDFFSPRMVSDSDAPPFVHKVVGTEKKNTPPPTGITATFTRNNNNNHSVHSGSNNHLGASADVRYSPFQQLSGSGMDKPMGAAESESGLGAGKSKAIPINASAGPEMDSFSSPTGQSRGFRIPTFRGNNAAAASYLASRSRIAASPLTGSLFPASMGSFMLGTPDENMAIDASLTAGLYGGGFSVMMKPPSHLHNNAAGDRGSSGDTTADMVPFPGSVGSEWAMTRQVTAASMFGESARAPLPASLFVARGMEIGGTSSDGERRSTLPVTVAHGHLHTAEYVEPSQLDESFSDLPSSPPQFPPASFSLDEAIGGIGHAHVDPMSLPMDSFNFNLEGHRKIQEMLQDPDAPPFLRRGGVH